MAEEMSQELQTACRFKKAERKEEQSILQNLVPWLYGSFTFLRKGKRKGMSNPHNSSRPAVWTAEFYSSQRF